MKSHTLHSIRKDYLFGQLLEEKMDPSPFNQFSVWLTQAMEKDVNEPTAMTVATVNQDGCPSARTVLLKYFSDSGFIFFTNYDSHKGTDIDSNPNIALLFFWSGLERQVRIEGRAEKITTKESDEYFQMRPVESQLAAYASPQSQVIPNRKYLIESVLSAKKQFYKKEVRRPENWGGYLVIPRSIEFWQGGTARLHDRIRYTLKNEEWVIERLAP